MQYLLSAEEYRALTQEISTREQELTRKLQEACTLAAMEIPLVQAHAPHLPPRPNGCVLAKGEGRALYCDDCPARPYCPSEQKRLSK